MYHAGLECLPVGRDRELPGRARTSVAKAVRVAAGPLSEALQLSHGRLGSGLPPKTIKLLEVRCAGEIALFL